MTPPAYTGPGPESDGSDTDNPVPLRPGGPCPYCDAEIEALDFIDLPGIAIKREMYDICVIDTDELATPWRHPTVIAYHENPSPYGEVERPPQPSID